MITGWARSGSRPPTAPLDRMLAEGYAPGELHAGGRTVGCRQDLDGAPLHLQRRCERRAGRDRDPAGEPGPTPGVARGFGWSLDDERVAVMHRSPNDVYIDEWVYELLELVETTGATRVMIDSLSDLQYATPDRVRFREFIYSLTQRLSRAGISPIMTSEIPELFQIGRLAEYGISTSPTTSSCCSTCAPNPASCAQSRSSNHAQAPTTRKSASSTSPPTASSSETHRRRRRVALPEHPCPPSSRAAAARG